MLNSPVIVCLCGSTKFYEEFMKKNYEFTMDGKIVLSVGFYPHAVKEAHNEDIGCTPEQKEKLDELHKRKIDLANEIFVINIGGYIGESTTSEIVYALNQNKKVNFLEEPPFWAKEMAKQKEKYLDEKFGMKLPAICDNKSEKVPNHLDPAINPDVQFQLDVHETGSELFSLSKLMEIENSKISAGLPKPPSLDD